MPAETGRYGTRREEAASQHYSPLEGTIMTCRAIPAGLLVATGLLAPAARADDVMRLDLEKTDTAGPTLGLDATAADTLNLASRGGGSHGGGHSSFHGSGFRATSFHGNGFRATSFHGNGFRATSFHGNGF